MKVTFASRESAWLFDAGYCYDATSKVELSRFAVCWLA